MSSSRRAPHHLPLELKDLVGRTLACLGVVIDEMEGRAFFRRVERYRTLMVEARDHAGKCRALKDLRRLAARETRADRLKLAHSFGLYLELVNCCESAYRTVRLREGEAPSLSSGGFHLTYVLTAHPTESRSPEVIAILGRVTRVLEETLQGERPLEGAADLSTFLRLLWKLPLGRPRKPTVLDEARHLFSILFAPEILDFVVNAANGEAISFHAWVGGDKDGHPGVDERVMVRTFEVSRGALVNWLVLKLTRLHKDLRPFEGSGARGACRMLVKMRHEAEGLRRVRPGDGRRVRRWRDQWDSLMRSSSPLIARHASAVEVSRAFVLFPAFVCPVEMREDARIVRESLRDHRLAIRRMVATVGKLCGPLGAEAYARGLILSHCESFEDIQAGAHLLESESSFRRVPVIPLFETRSALAGGGDIVREWLRHSRWRRKIRRDGEGRLQIMLGYSDSSKEVGALPSRLLVREVMASLDKTIAGAGFKPIFFHGSGGSVERGGGSLKDQLDWWPRAVLSHLKMTIQGEMVQRQLASPEILRSQIAHLADHARSHRSRGSAPAAVRRELRDFANAVEREYRGLVDGPWLRPLLDASPFNELDHLTLGSRPNKRPSRDVSVANLRAIPWVLCWTQTRLLLPTWWGLGRAWSQSSLAAKRRLRETYARDPFFRSFVKSLGFTLEKMDVDVWEMYADHADLAAEIRRGVASELEAVKIFFRELTGQDRFVFDRPWLRESIGLRSSSIHLLNILQIRALADRDFPLLRETTTGIACGMLTTG